jgi:hypothetical protein
MPTYDLLQTRFQRSRVESPREAKGKRHVIAWIVGFELVEKPESPLGEGEGGAFDARPSGDSREGRPRPLIPSQPFGE